MGERHQNSLGSGDNNIAASGFWFSGKKTAPMSIENLVNRGENNTTLYTRLTKYPI